MTQAETNVVERAKVVANALIKVSELLKKGLFVGSDALEVATAVSFCDNFSSQIVKDLMTGEKTDGEVPPTA